MYPYGVTVTRLRATQTTNGYGNTELSWDNPHRLDFPGCAVAPRTEDEERERGRQGVIIGWTVYIPQVPADVRFDDRMEIPAGVFEVEGDPGPWHNPYTGHQPGTVVNLRRVDG